MIQCNVGFEQRHLDALAELDPDNRSEANRDAIDRYADTQAALLDCIASAPRWVYVVEGDAATLPKTNALMMVAIYYRYGDHRWVGEAHCVFGSWRSDDDFGYEIEGDGVTVYAWRPWPKAPPVEVSE